MRKLLMAVLVLAFLAPVCWAEDKVGFPSQIRAQEKMPTLAGVDLQGSPISITDELGAKTIVLSFWSIYCTNCVKELDDLATIRKEFNVEDVTVVAVNTDSGMPIERIRSFLDRYETSRGGDSGLVHLLDRNNEIVNQLGIVYIPFLTVVDEEGTVASVVSGYLPDQDKQRLYRVIEEGRLAHGAWGSDITGRVRSILRTAGPTGKVLEWGTFKIEQGQSLFGYYDGSGWIADIASKPDRDKEVARVENMVRDRLKISLLRHALESVGVKLPEACNDCFKISGIHIPESPFLNGDRWTRFYWDINFGELYTVDDRVEIWAGDHFWSALVANVDLGRMRDMLASINFPFETSRIKVRTVSDYDFKVRLAMNELQNLSYRLKSIDGEHLEYYGTPSKLVEELTSIEVLGDRPFATVVDGKEVRMEIF